MPAKQPQKQTQKTASQLYAAFRSRITRRGFPGGSANYTTNGEEAGCPSPSFQVASERLRTAVLWGLPIFLSILVTGKASGACGYADPVNSCPYCGNEPVVLPVGTALLNASIKWCGISQAPCVNNPALVCQSDFKTVMWRRHERPSDCIWIPQCEITLRSGGVINVSQYKQFNDLDTSIGNPGDIVVDGTNTELDDTFTACDMAWNTPTPQPKGIIAISANRLVDNMGNPIARGISYVGSITRPWMAFADPTENCQLNERSVAHEFGHVLSLGHVTTTGNLMVTGGTGATLDMSQCTQTRTYLQNNTILDPNEATNVNLVGFTFRGKNDLKAETNFLQIFKIVAVDNSPTKGDLIFTIGTDGLLPRKSDQTTKYWIMLDTDNNPQTGGNPTNIVPGRPISGVEFVCQVSVTGTNATATLYQPGEFGAFVPVLLAPGLITAVPRDITYVICDPTPAYTGPTEIPRFTEIDFRVANAALALSGISTGGVGGLFSRGLRIQGVGATPTTRNFSMTPEGGGVIQFPPIVFPQISVPPSVFVGQLMPLSVSRMPTNALLELMFANNNIQVGSTTDKSGSADFQILVPANTPLGPRLLSVGVADPNDATTADTVVNVLAQPQLNIRLASTNVVLTWPASSVAFKLQSTDVLPSKIWTSVEQSPVLVGDQYTVTLPLSRTNRYFELASP